MELKEHLKIYDQSDYSYIPIPHRTKKAVIQWGEYMERKPNEAEKQRWFGNGKPTNVAVICGKISGGEYWLVVTEFDLVSEYEKFKNQVEEKLLLDLTDITPVVRTGRGYHVYWLVKEAVKSEKHSSHITLEIRSDGNYVLVPPSIHPMGRTYKFINPDVTIPYTLDSLLDVGIDVNQSKPQKADGTPENWISEAMEGVPEGQRDDTCTRLAGYYIGKDIPPDIVKSILHGLADKCPQPPEAKEPFTHQDVDRIVDSIYFKERLKVPQDTIEENLLRDYPPSDTNTGGNNTLFNTKGLDENRDCAVTNRNNFVTSSWGQYSIEFDEIMSRAGDTPQDSRLVAEALGLRSSHPTFRRIKRDREANGKIRPYKHSPYLIQWINREYEETILGKVKKTPILGIKLPLGIHELASLTPRSVVGLAGTTGGGKTAFMLELAELNVFTQPMPIYYWYNEGGQEMFELRCEDYPLLVEAQREGQFHAIEQTNFEIGDVIKPDAINLVDYVDRNEDFFKIGGDVKQLYTPLGTGIVVFGIQKHPDSKYGLGGVQGVKLSSLYITLDGTHTNDRGVLGKATIIKARYYADPSDNPREKVCQYKTGGKWGKLFKEGEWKR